jgi:UMF1 family MFS transporter
MTSVAVAEVDGLEPTAEKVLMEPPRDGQKTSDSDSGEMAALRPAESCLPARSVDETPVSRSEKVAWWFTAFAAEPFAAGGLGLFVTSLVEALAAQAGFQTADPTQPCNVGEPGYNCSVKVGSLTVNTSSLVLYTSALGIITQLLIFLSLGPQADFGGRRKIFLLLFAWLGAVSALLFFGATTPEMWPLATIALLFSTIGLGTFVVFNNAFLPILARYDPSVIAAASVGDVAIASSQHEAVLNTLSVHGIAISSTGGFIGIGICVGIVFATGGALTSLAYACGAMGAWWTIFLFLPFFLLRSRPGPPFPAGENALTMGWKRLWQTAKQASKLKTLMWFLAYWFALADATSVISASSVLFAQVNLGFGTQDLVIISLVIPVAVILGAYGFLGLQKLFKLQTVTTNAFVLYVSSSY